ncbi:Chalcone--flavonone isomerase 1B-1 [Spatholobus suberectus]|nr:Chalcone--flavonone isomerase 1B-1 [Spatholobus suberectus]
MEGDGTLSFKEEDGARNNGGRGERGEVTIEGESVKVTAIGVYWEDKAVSLIAAKWKGKSAAELLESLDFYRDIIKGTMKYMMPLCIERLKMKHDFLEKLIRGSKIISLDGPEYVRKLSENCVAHMKSVGTYSNAEEKAIGDFRYAFYFKDQNFPPCASVFYKQLPTGTLGLSFSKDENETIPEHEYAVIDNKPLSEAVLAGDYDPRDSCFPCFKREFGYKVLCVSETGQSQH